MIIWMHGRLAADGTSGEFDGSIGNDLNIFTNEEFKNAVLKIYPSAICRSVRAPLAIAKAKAK